MAALARKNIDIPLEKLCRCCLRSGPAMRHLFGRNREATETEAMAVKYNECSASKIAKHDGFPQFICEPCAVLLDAAFMFRQISAKSDKEMRSMTQFEVLIEDELQTNDMVEHYLETPPDETGHFENDDYTRRTDDYCAPIDIALLEIKIEASEHHPLIIPKEEMGYSPEKSIPTSQSVIQTVQAPTKPDNPKQPYRRKSRAFLPRNHQCDLCGATSKTISNLRDHRNTHFPPENPVICDLCQKQFRDKRSIILHMRTHTGERPYVCEQCGKAFKTSAAIHRHQSVHTGERNFPCKLCTYRAGTRANLAIHERIHSGVQPFPCTQCPQKFSTISNQKKHIRSMHEVSDEFMCNCGRRCSSSAMLRQHINQHLGLKPYECPGCTMKYSFYTALIKHARIHHPDVQLPKERSYAKPVFDEEALKQLSKQRK